MAPKQNHFPRKTRVAARYYLSGYAELFSSDFQVLIQISLEEMDITSPGGYIIITSSSQRGIFIKSPF